MKGDPTAYRPQSFFILTDHHSLSLPPLLLSFPLPPRLPISLPLSSQDSWPLYSSASSILLELPAPLSPPLSVSPAPSFLPQVIPSAERRMRGTAPPSGGGEQHEQAVVAALDLICSSSEQTYSQFLASFTQLSPS